MKIGILLDSKKYKKFSNQFGTKLVCWDGIFYDFHVKDVRQSTLDYGKKGVGEGI